MPIDSSVLSRDSARLDRAQHAYVVGPVSGYPHLEYSMHAVRRAGQRLGDGVPWREEDRADILETFAIAHSWRDSHVYPMRSVRQSIIQRMRYAEIGGFTAARAKRMSSVRKKLQREKSMKLDQINDLAGCRAILDDIKGVRLLIAECQDKLPHELRQQYDYINRCKDDGYRSHHMVFNFRGTGENVAFDGRRVELQIRTRLQHSWATAVEAVGLFRGEDMKAGQGHPDWLRLFKLMSDEFAIAEGCDGGLISTRSDRVAQIRALNQSLRATGVLEDLKSATHFVQNFIYDESPYYLITYNNEDHSVNVKPYSDARLVTSSLDSIERQIETGETSSKVVLVNVDKIDSLVEAYPNYFGDVALFVRNLKSICDGQQAVEFTMAPQAVVAPRAYDKPDLSWFRQKHRKWFEKK